MLLLELAGSLSWPTVEGLKKSGRLELTQGCFQSGIVADLWNVPSFVLLKKSQGSNKRFLLEQMSSRKRSILGLIPGKYRSRRLPRQDKDHYVGGPPSFPGFFC